MTSTINPIMATPHEKLHAIQAGRAIAAIMVVAYHANDFVLPLRLYEGRIAWRGFGMGYVGVEFFFVLSGFIIFYGHRQDFGRPWRFWMFIYKRFSRIYPIYWIILIFILIIYSLLPKLTSDIILSNTNIIRSFLLVPNIERTILPVAWTLEHEVFFYLIFSITIINQKLGLSIFFLWMASCLTCTNFNIKSNFLIVFITSPYNLLFMFGMLSYLIYDKIPKFYLKVFFLLGFSGIIMVGLSEEYFFAWSLNTRTIAYGISATLLVIALARQDQPWPRNLVLLGNASYAIYLVHLPAMNILAIVFAKIGVQHVLSPLVMFGLLSAAAVVTGTVFHLIVERPLLARLAGPRRRVGLQPDGQ